MQSNKAQYVGAIASFLGQVRADRIEGSGVEMIEFSAQREIAEKTAEAIVQEGITRFGVDEIEIRHSLGPVSVGAICFAVVIKSGHRKECYEALPFVVDAVKSRCPIFGKEIVSGGEHRWKKNT